MSGPVLTSALVPCPVCLGPIDPIADYAMKKDGFDLVRCAHCGLLMRALLPTEAELQEIYSPDYFRDEEGAWTNGYSDYLGDEDNHRATAARRLGLIESAVGGRAIGRRLLDVGSAAGFFVAEAEKHGWDAQGVDVAREMVEWGCAHLGANLIQGTLADVGDDQSFDVVSMWDYIEHSLDPAGDLQRTYEVLSPGGMLALSTGDLGSLVARVSGKRWHLLTPRHHNFFFSASTIRALLERLDYINVNMWHAGAPYSIRHLTYKLDRMVRVPGLGWLTHRLGRSRVGNLNASVNLLDIVTVIAQKPEHTG